MTAHMKSFIKRAVFRLFVGEYVRKNGNVKVNAYEEKMVNLLELAVWSVLQQIGICIIVINLCRSQKQTGIKLLLLAEGLPG